MCACVQIHAAAPSARLVLLLLLLLRSLPAVYSAANISGGHLNPAVTFSTLICGFYPVWLRCLAALTALFVYTVCKLSCHEHMWLSRD
jgi:glycerol uptake facilitator-like aquaporin